MKLPVFHVSFLAVRSEGAELTPGLLQSRVTSPWATKPRLQSREGSPEADLQVGGQHSTSSPYHTAAAPMTSYHRTRSSQITTKQPSM